MFYNWSSTLIHNFSNSTADPFNAIIQQTTNAALPWFWPAFPFILYLYLFILFRDAPGRMKFVFIALLGLVISIFMTAGGLLSDAVINVVIFAIALFASNLFKG